VEAKGGITLHPGPGPFGPGPGPFAALTGRPSSRSCVSLSAEDPAPETAVIAAAVANTITALAHFDRLVTFALLLFKLMLILRAPARLRPSAPVHLSNLQTPPNIPGLMSRGTFRSLDVNRGWGIKSL